MKIYPTNFLWDTNVEEGYVYCDQGPDCDKTRIKEDIRWPSIVL